VAWFKGDAGMTVVGPNVTAWADQSGNGNDVSAGATAPLLVGSAINGIAGANFNSPSGPILQNTTTNLLTAGSARSVIVVCKPTSGPGTYTVGGNAVVFRLHTAAFGMLVASVGGSTYGYTSESASAALASPPAITDVSLVAEIYSTGTGSTPTFAINGTNYTVAGSPTVAAENGTTGFSIGNFAQALTQFFTGSICEVLIFDHALVAGEVTTVRQYLQPRYGINLGV